MEITFVGHSCFKIKGKTQTLVIDPYDPKIGFKLPKLEADIVLSTHDHFDHANTTAVTGFKMAITGPGEYEIGGVLISGLPTFHDDKNGDKQGGNTIYLIDMDGVSLLHLGDLGHELPDSALENIGKVDVLMIPVGGNYTIDAETAAKVISSIEPGFVIPMHYKTSDLSGIDGLESVDKFLDEMGVENNVKKLDRLKISSKGDIPEETEIVVLDPAH
jgi:L-ascorbate metabolism protein UlaG (beta-lactamase superfamily)